MLHDVSHLPTMKNEMIRDLLCVPELLLSSVDSDNVTDLSLFEPSFPEQATNDVAQAITVANDKTFFTKNPP